MRQHRIKVLCQSQLRAGRRRLRNRRWNFFTYSLTWPKCLEFDKIIVLSKDAMGAWGAAGSKERALRLQGLVRLGLPSCSAFPLDNSDVGIYRAANERCRARLQRCAHGRAQTLPPCSLARTPFTACSLAPRDLLPRLGLLRLSTTLQGKNGFRSAISCALHSRVTRWLNFGNRRACHSSPCRCALWTCAGQNGQYLPPGTSIWSLRAINGRNTRTFAWTLTACLPIDASWERQSPTSRCWVARRTHQLAPWSWRTFSGSA